MKMKFAALALAALTAMFCEAACASDAEKRPMVLAQLKATDTVKPNAPADQRAPAGKKTGSAETKTPKQLTKNVALSSWDCKTVNGTVVETADDRCGKSGQYCKLPGNGGAVCIDVRN